MTVSVSRSGSVTILNLGDDENRFSPSFLDDVNRALDEVVSGEPSALVTTGTGKFFSNGLDLDWLMANEGQWAPYVDSVQALLSRILTLPVPTVAAVNGHAFGAGGMLALAHDFRVMRADRGFLCVPEVDIRIPFTSGMAALLQSKLTPQAAVNAMTTGRRFGGPDAVAAGLVDSIADESELTGAAVAIAEPLVGKDQATLEAIKSVMFAEVTSAFAIPTKVG